MWIKYLTLPIWCHESFIVNGSYYVLPPLNTKFFNNKFIYDAFIVLKNIRQLTYGMNLIDQRYNEDEIKNIIINAKKSEILKKENEELKTKLSNLKEEVKKRKKKKYGEKVRKTRYPPIDPSDSSDSSDSS